jgi:hypothetical protein
MTEKFQTLEVRCRKSSKAWKFFAVLFPMLGSLAFAQGPGSQIGFFQAWWGTQGFDPIDISGIEWWIDASDATSISLQAGTNLVSQWDDKSGKGKHLTQATSGNRPAWIENEKNGNAVIRFDGSNDFMSVPSSIALFDFMHQSNTTWFAVARFGTNQYPGVNMALFDNTAQSAGAGVSFAYRSTFFSITNAFQVRINRALLSYVMVQEPNNSGIGNQYVLVSHLADVSAPALDRSKLTINQTLYQTNTETNAPVVGAAANNLTLGQYSNLVNPLRGDICEIIIYSGILSDADTARVRNYLKAKWGL